MKEFIFGLIIANIGVYTLLIAHEPIENDCKAMRIEVQTWQEVHPSSYLPDNLVKQLVGCLEY